MDMIVFEKIFTLIEVYKKAVVELFIYLKKLHKHPLNNFANIKVLTFSLKWIIRFFSNTEV